MPRARLVLQVHRVLKGLSEVRVLRVRRAFKERRVLRERRAFRERRVPRARKEKLVLLAPKDLLVLLELQVLQVHRAQLVQ